MKWVGLALILATIILITLPSAPKGDTCLSAETEGPNGETLALEIAASPAARTDGLSHRTSLAPRHGMLFLFPSAGIYPFWMKDTLIPLDIIWLDNHRIVDITTLEIEEGSLIPQYTPSAAADAVIELNKGEAHELGLTKGDSIIWPPCEKIH